jgi:hypothetical protein
MLGYTSSVIPGRREAAKPESMTPVLAIHFQTVIMDSVCAGKSL